MRYALLFMLLTISVIGFAEENQQGCPYHQSHQASGLNDRGDQVMGFSKEKTTHHFLLLKDGGTILVEAKDPQDQQTIGLIRRHMTYVAEAFAEGNFDMPHAIHLQVPPGAEIMKESKDKISYQYQETEKGGSVLIRTNDSEALSAVHEFLDFQIKEHKTGDPLTVQ